MSIDVTALREELVRHGLDVDDADVRIAVKLDDETRSLFASILVGDPPLFAKWIEALGFPPPLRLPEVYEDRDRRWQVGESVGRVGPFDVPVAVWSSVDVPAGGERS